MRYRQTDLKKIRRVHAMQSRLARNAARLHDPKGYVYLKERVFVSLVTKTFFRGLKTDLKMRGMCYNKSKGKGF